MSVAPSTFHALLYLHNWDPDGKVYPEVSGLYNTAAEAHTARGKKVSPEKYWVRTAHVVSQDADPVHPIGSQDKQA
jgi:hypothetical protein